MTNSLREEIEQALAQAGDKGQMCRVNTLRLIMAAIKDWDEAAQGQGGKRAGDNEILRQLAKMIEQRKEASAAYEEAGRLDLARQEQEEIEIIRSFLPPPFVEEEVREACRSVVSELSADGLRDMGKCVSTLKARYPGQMNFCFAKQVMRELLQ